MINKDSIDDLRANLRRIFVMKISRSTFREVQNALITACGGQKDNLNKLFEWFMTGKPDTSMVDRGDSDVLKDLVEEFSIPVRLSREISERGDFVNIITSDTLSQKEGQQDKVAFVNRVRRIDGEEFHFITDPESTLHLIRHFGSRLMELQKTEESKALLEPYKKDIQAISKLIASLSS